MCELNREAIKGARLIANPGCYPTCSILSIYPAVKEGLIDPDTIIIDAKSGTSGAGRGREASESVLRGEREYQGLRGCFPPAHAGDRRAAGAGGRKTTLPELYSHLVPMNRGILVTAYASLKKEVSPGKRFTRCMSVTMRRSSLSGCWARENARRPNGWKAAITWMWAFRSIPEPDA